MALIALGALLLVTLGLGVRGMRAEGKTPAVGSSAPDLTLNSQEAKPVSLRDFKGKWVVLYFYPKGFTSGRNVEARDFQRDLAQYEQANSVIVGVSVQNEHSHKRFCAKEGLNFKLLADTKTEVSALYGSVMNLGVVRNIFSEVKPQQKSEETLAALVQLQAAAAR